MAHSAPRPGGPRSATAQNFVQHQLSHLRNFWCHGRAALFRLESRSDGQAQLSLTFQLPSPSEVIPPPTFNHPPAPALSPRPIIPLFPVGKVPHRKPKPPTQKFSSKQRKSYRRSVLHRATQATTNLPPPPPGTFRMMCGQLLQQAPPQPPRNHTPTQQSSMKRPHTSSPPSVSQRCREDFKLLESEDEFSSPSPSSENLREAFLLSAPLSLSLDPASPKKDALLSRLD